MFITIPGRVGVFRLDLAMDGSVGDFIHTEAVTGAQEDIIVDTDTAIIEDTNMVNTTDIVPVMLLVAAVLTEMFITIAQQESGKQAMSEIHGHQIL